jgi:hypothetical protein
MAQRIDNLDISPTTAYIGTENDTLGVMVA